MSVLVCVLLSVVSVFRGAGWLTWGRWGLGEGSGGGGEVNATGEGTWGRNFGKERDRMGGQTAILLVERDPF